ncbi:polysaccharide pyruvyl transferase family protein [Enterococcus sp. N342-3-1-2]
MKIGILTFQNATNYGAILQAYALQKSIESLNLNYQVEIIDYRQKQLEKQYSPTFFDKSSGLKGIIRFTLYFPLKFRKKKIFNKFINENINLSKKFLTKYQIDSYDCFFVGSDQVWNLEITKNDSAYLLDFVENNNDIKKIAYAASIGKNDLKDNEISLFEKYIPLFDKISVREGYLKKIINKFTIVEVEEVLDPTLLLNANRWLEITDINKYKGQKFLLVYALEDNLEMRKVITRISEKLDLEVIELIKSGDSFANKFFPRTIFSPQDFLSLFYNATYVVTNSFHGTAFSVIFEKNFITVPHTTRGSRMINLLNMCDLSDRLVTKFDEDSINNLVSNPDFKNCKKSLDYMRALSLDFIKDCLNE